MKAYLLYQTSSIIEAVNNSRTMSEAARKLGVSELDFFEIIGHLYSSGVIRDFRFK
jgi:hypothetical protein